MPLWSNLGKVLRSRAPVLPSFPRGSIVMMFGSTRNLDVLSQCNKRCSVKTDAKDTITLWSPGSGQMVDVTGSRMRGKPRRGKCDVCR